MNNEEENIHYVKCEDCGRKILSGDVHYIAGRDVCEYCYDNYSSEDQDEAGY